MKTVLVCALLMSQTTQADVLANLKQAYPATEFSSVQASEIPGIYAVQMGQNRAYVDESGRYWLFGRLYDMQTQTDLTAQSERHKIDLVDRPVADAIVRGQGSRHLVVISDPLCVHCRALEQDLTKLSDVTVETYLMPSSPEARKLADSVRCAKDRVAAWEGWMLRNRRPPTLGCPASTVAGWAQRLGIRATPTIIRADGRILLGAVGVARLEQFLAEAP